MAVDETKERQALSSTLWESPPECLSVATADWLTNYTLVTFAFSLLTEDDVVD